MLRVRFDSFLCDLYTGVDQLVYLRCQSGCVYVFYYGLLDRDMQIDDRKQQTGICKLATQSVYSIILHLNRHCCNNKYCFENQKKNYAIPRPSQSCTWEGREEGAGDKIGFSNAINFRNIKA